MERGGWRGEGWRGEGQRGEGPKGWRGVEGVGQRGGAEGAGPKGWRGAEGAEGVEPEDFCGGHKVFRHILMSHEIFFTTFDVP